ncbi:tRNA uracil 4-sulfurtransferase ThiI [Salinicoccus albus]|uniref:tRNA uracil 4-sulfurtransferase ThiI n=1 Tax=Salinicoccus albus TaxID=418756 RepID=UPI000372159C|nr:tRNA uracil 4-sulfurtransferase ThiI [Salinicoccus albus]
MNYDHILVRYGELTLKSKNRKIFVDALRRTMIQTLEPFGVHVKANRDRAYIELNNADPYKVMDALKHVTGILSVSPVVKLEKTNAAMQKNAVDFAHEFQDGSTFKIEVKRADKGYPLKTFDIQQLLGSHVLENTEEITVDVRQPDYEIMVEVRQDAVYMYREVIACVGGFPAGTGGRAILMLSGGIDSPVAAFEIMKKGVEVEAVHFHSPPYTSPQATEKVKQLVDIISDRTGVDIRLNIVPFTELQTTIYDRIPQSLSMTSTRRIMLRIAEKLASRKHAGAIVNGENLGQVASQTMTSMHVINRVTSFPILRPLLTLEKDEIIGKAKAYGTYETSILPFEDCCTIFTPKSPKTKPSLEKVEGFESRVDFEPLIDEAADNIEVYISNTEAESESFESLL